MFLVSEVASPMTVAGMWRIAILSSISPWKCKVLILQLLDVPGVGGGFNNDSGGDVEARNNVIHCAVEG